jgi:hypothetical protein
VGDHDHLHGELIALENRYDFRNVVTGIDDDRLAADLIPEHRTIAFQWADRQNFVDHLR